LTENRLGQDATVADIYDQPFTHFLKIKEKG
jgi:hypothetical protein